MSITVPEGVLSSILDRLDRLERSAPGAQEALSPNYLTIDTAGLISALFTGGIQIPEMQGPPTGFSSSRMIAFVDPSNTVQETILATGSGASHQVYINSNIPGAADYAQLAVSSQRGQSGRAQANVAVNDAAGHNDMTLYRADGASSFLQITSGAANAILSVVGTNTLTWPATGAASNLKNITLPGAAGSVFGVALPSGFVNNPSTFDTGIMVLGFPAGGGICQFQAVTQSRNAPGASGTMTFAYILWGT